MIIIVTISGKGKILYTEHLQSSINYFDDIMRIKNHMEQIGTLNKVDEFHLKMENDNAE